MNNRRNCQNRLLRYPVVHLTGATIRNTFFFFTKWTGTLFLKFFLRNVHSMSKCLEALCHAKPAPPHKANLQGHDHLIVIVRNLVRYRRLSSRGVFEAVPPMQARINGGLPTLSCNGVRLSTIGTTTTPLDCLSCFFNYRCQPLFMSDPSCEAFHATGSYG